MTITVLFFILYLAVASWIIFSPLLNLRETNLQMILDQTADSRKKLQTKRSELMRTLKELDFDYEMGKLSKEDYRSLRTKYETETIEVLKAIETDTVDRQEFQDELENKLKKYDA